MASSDTLIDVDMLKIDLVQASGEALSGGHEKMALDLMEAYASLEMADDLERMLEAGAPMVVTPQSGK